MFEDFKHRNVVGLGGPKMRGHASMSILHRLGPGLDHNPGGPPGQLAIRRA
jgi:hypothetical protein